MTTLTPPKPGIATTSAYGLAKLATSGQNASGVVVQGDDIRLNRNTIVVLGSTFTTNSATPVDVTGFSVTLADPGTYNILINGFVQSPNAATGANLTLTISGSPTRRSFSRKQFTSATIAIDDMINIDDGGTVAATMGGVNVDRNVLLAGCVITNGSNCTLQVRAVRGGTSNTISVMAGSNIIAQKIA